MAFHICWPVLPVKRPSGVWYQQTRPDFPARQLRISYFFARIKPRDRFLDVDDVDLVTSTENVRSHFVVPAAGAVSVVHARFQNLYHDNLSRILRDTFRAKHSRVYSSMIASHFREEPELVLSKTKSHAQTWFRRSTRWRMQP